MFTWPSDWPTIVRIVWSRFRITSNWRNTWNPHIYEKTSEQILFYTYRLHMPLLHFLKSLSFVLFKFVRHQPSISSTLNVRKIRTNVHFGSFYYVHVTRKKLPKWPSYEKRFMLMKLTAGVNSINILRMHFSQIFWLQKLQSCVLDYYFLALKYWRKKRT